MSYISMRIRAVSAVRGYDGDKKLVTELNAPDFKEKVIKLDRILSFTEDYIFIACPHETVELWEYEGTLEDVKSKLRSVGQLL
ncbi:MAG TPA: hypothetical protein GXX48_05235 [Ochrobactrum intermedium]|uniref:Uncharacterized protein n=1 Tax=Brucella intermedia TaxID=94625 RepID=A0A7V6PA28_9HYPH|nr:hypothetical protein [Brucella intermedia]HHV67031.1 hypothetical protein [Brucella intermedia]